MVPFTWFRERVVGVVAAHAATALPKVVGRRSARFRPLQSLTALEELGDDGPRIAARAVEQRVGDVRKQLAQLLVAVTPEHIKRRTQRKA